MSDKEREMTWDAAECFSRKKKSVDIMCYFRMVWSSQLLSEEIFVWFYLPIHFWITGSWLALRSDQNRQFITWLQ